MKLSKNKTNQLTVQSFRNKITSLEKKLLAQENPNIVKGNSDSFPLTHSFSDGVYIREMSMLKDGIVIGKIHDRSQTWFLMKGKLKIVTENGIVVYTAPTYVNAPAGAKRVIQALENSVFVNVHPNPDNTTDIKTLEERLTCVTYEAFENKHLKQE
tara:strand:- start:700 stop:1167 length:468 start_codon:yes stop_codon:yes gene_type:complete